jgi:hypothetical protein
MKFPKSSVRSQSTGDFGDGLIRVNPHSEFLNRFTTLPVVLHILSTKSITLLESTHWEDRNDAYYLERYQKERDLNTLLAACFSTKRETFHHWKVFASGSSGVCVEFRTDKFLRHFQNREGISFRRVFYSLIKDNINPPVRKWPFLKRHAYKDEGEFRIIYEHEHEHDQAKSFEIDLGCIDKITLSPWLPVSIEKSVTDTIRGIEGCGKIKVNRSTLLESRKWQACIWPSR